MLDFLEDLSQSILNLVERVAKALEWKLLILAVLIPLIVVVCCIAYHLIGSFALSRIAKRQGARRRIVVLCWLPFVRYFAIGKLAERCDARCGKQIGNWSKLATCVGMPLMLVASLLFWVALTLLFAAGMLLSMICMMDSFYGDQGFLIQVFEVISAVVWVLLYLVAMLLGGRSYLILIIPLLLAVICAVLCVVLGVFPLCISYVCYAKILRGYFRSPQLGVWIAASVVLGLFPIALLVASFKEPLPAVAYDV